MLLGRTFVIQQKVSWRALEGVVMMNYIALIEQLVVQCLWNTATKTWHVRMLMGGRLAFIRKCLYDSEHDNSLSSSLGTLKDTDNGLRARLNTTEHYGRLNANHSLPKVRSQHKIMVFSYAPFMHLYFYVDSIDSWQIYIFPCPWACFWPS